MSPVARRVGLLIAVLVLVLLILVWLSPAKHPRVPSIAADTTRGHTECPHDWANTIAYRGDSALDSVNRDSRFQLSVPGPTTNIPEFHDCQRFVVARDGQLVNDSVFAIFGAWDLAARYDSLLMQPPTKASPALPVTTVRGNLATQTPLASVQTPRRSAVGPATLAKSAWGLTEIYARNTYAPLGIGPGFNCVYVYRTGDGLEARVVPFGRKEANCARPANPDTLAGTVLQVVATKLAPYSRTDFPAAARWDWDEQDTIQYFGVKCGDSWCEVGPAGFQSSTQPVPRDMAALEPGLIRRVFDIKGWFDEQQLDEPNVAWPLAPAPVRGALYPDPNLDAHEKPDFSGTWVRTVRVGLWGPEVGYRNKLNLRSASGPPSGNLRTSDMNTIELCWSYSRECHGLDNELRARVRANGCGPNDGHPDENPEDRGTWWAKITSPGKSFLGIPLPAWLGGPRTKYYCVRRRVHPDFVPFPWVTFTSYPIAAIRIPGTARWHWLMYDPIVWQSCSDGCCEVQPE
jgi:hypothetical protein